MSSAATLPETARGPAEIVPSDIELRTFGYRDDDEWVVVALEMDLRGYGATYEEAVEELRELALLQLSFAVSKRQPDLVWKEAEPVWFARWESSNRERLMSIAAGRPRDVQEPSAATLRIPEDAVADAIRTAAFAKSDA